MDDLLKRLKSICSLLECEPAHKMRDLEQAVAQIEWGLNIEWNKTGFHRTKARGPIFDRLTGNIK